MVQALRACVQAVQVALTNRVGSGKQAELRVRCDDPVLVQQSELAVAFQHALNDKHHVGAARVVFVKYQGHRPLQCPGHDAFLKFSDLLAAFQDHGVAANKVKPADVAVQVDAHTGPVQARCHLFDVRAFARAVQALQHDAPIACEASQDGQGHIGVEAIGRVDFRHMFVALFKHRHEQLGVKTKQLACTSLLRGVEMLQVGHGEVTSICVGRLPMGV